MEANASEREMSVEWSLGSPSPSANAHCVPTTHQKPCLVLVFVQNTWAHKVVGDLLSDLNPTRTPKQTKHGSRPEQETHRDPGSTDQPSQVLPCQDKEQTLSSACIIPGNRATSKVAEGSHVCPKARDGRERVLHTGV